MGPHHVVPVGYPDHRAILEEVAELCTTAKELELDPLELAAQRVRTYRDATRQLREERDHYRAPLYGRFAATG